MEVNSEGEKPQQKVTDFLDRPFPRKIITLLSLVIALFLPIYTRTNNGVMLETIFYFPWAILRIFEPNPLYKTDQLQVVHPFATIIIMIPTYIAIFELFKLLDDETDLIKSSLKIAGAEFSQIILIFLTLQSSGRPEEHSTFFLGPILLILVFLTIASALYLEKARNDLYKG